MAESTKHSVHHTAQTARKALHLLTERGLPTPNLFTGGHNPHGPLEWASVQAMEKAVEVGVRLAQLWAEQGASYPRRYSK